MNTVILNAYFLLLVSLLVNNFSNYQTIKYFRKSVLNNPELIEEGSMIFIQVFFLVGYNQF